MEAWQQFVVQLVVTLVPLGIAIANQNKRIAKLESENAELRKDNDEMEQRLERLTTDHESLQRRYETNLKAQAGMRDRF
jgi:predicted RNase H-like nuclease (RuvC/YqgF family)